MKTILFVFGIGTGLEAIKMTPDLFRIVPVFDLNLMSERQTLTQLTANILVALDPVLIEVQPDWVLVQGDTTTAMITSLSAFYHNINIGHIEAGLRTPNRRAPFPEEINRRITGVVADVHFASTERHLILISGENITMRAELGMKNLWNTWRPYGIHHPDGILYLSGAGVKKGKTIDSANVYDNCTCGLIIYESVSTS